MRPGLLLRAVGVAALGAVLAACGAGSPTTDPTEAAVSSPAPSVAPPFELVVQQFLPQGPARGGGPVPLIVLVPGGRWVSADPSGFTDLAERLAADGSAVVTTTYRTWDEGATFPVPIQDVVCAINGSAARVAESGVDIGPVVVVGHSAGAQLAALAGLVGDRYQADCAQPYVPVDGFVGLAGPYDLMALSDVAAALLGSSPTEDPDSWSAANPIEQVTARPELPVLLLHGTVDDEIPTSSSKDFATALQAAGHVVTLDLVPDANHFTVATADAAAQPIEDFVDSLGSGG